MSSPSSVASPAAPRRRETPRVALARVAASAASTVDGVAALDCGPTRRQVTATPDGSIEGVVVMPSDARHDVELYVRAAPIDLHDLGQRISSAVRAAAAAAGRADELGAVHVTVTDIAPDLESLTP